MATYAPAQNPLPRVHEIYNFGRPFLGHDYYILGLSDLCLGVKKKIFKKIYFTLFTPKLPPLWNLHFLVSLPQRCYTPNLIKFGSVNVVLDKKMLTHDA